MREKIAKLARRAAVRQWGRERAAMPHHARAQQTRSMRRTVTP